MNTMPFAALSDQALIGEVKRLATEERQATGALVSSLAEFDARRLYLGEGCASLFAYCTHVLRLSEHAAYHRIEAARAARRFPLVLERLVAGDLTLTAIGLLAPHLTSDNCRALLDEATNRSKREVEELVARLHPRPESAASIRKVPERRGEASCGSAGMSPSLSLARADERRPEATDAATPVGCSVPAPARRAAIRPLAPARYHLQVTVSLETHEKLRQAQDLLRHVVPSGDLAVIIDRALSLLVADLRRTRQRETRRRPGPRRATAEPVDASTQAPATGIVAVSTPREVPAPSGLSRVRTPSRHIPAAVARAVWQRDGAQCAFIGAEGRCPARSFLELHHRIPYADGGPSTVENVELRCRAHNAYEATLHVAHTLALDVDDDQVSPTAGADRTPILHVGGLDRTRSGPS